MANPDQVRQLGERLFAVRALGSGEDASRLTSLASNRPDRPRAFKESRHISSRFAFCLISRRGRGGPAGTVEAPLARPSPRVDIGVSI